MTTARAVQVQHRGGGRVRALLDLVRVGTVVAGCCLCIIGARLGGGTARPERIAWAVACVGLLIAFAQVVNDVVDVEVDRLEKPHRPLVSGALSVRGAVLLAAALGLAGLAAAARAGDPRLLPFAAVVLAASWGYLAWWKATVVFGNVVVALLASSPIMFGAAAAGEPTASACAAQVVVLLFMAAFEVLKTGRDLEGDSAAGLRTIATRHGLRTTSRVGAILCIGASVAAVVPTGLTEHRLGYVVVMGGGAVAPTLAAAVLLLRSEASPHDLARSFALLRLAWFAGVASLALL